MLWRAPRSPRLREVYVRELESTPILVRYEIICRRGLFGKTLHTFYLTVSYEARVYPMAPQGSVSVDANMPNEHKILTTAKMALAKRFGYDRVLIRHSYPFNF